MKAERRHELKENELAKSLQSAPAFFQEYGSRILLGVIIALLIVVLIRNYLAGKSNRAALTATDLGQAYFALNHLRNPDLDNIASMERLAEDRAMYAKDIETSVADLLNRTQDAKLRAQAYLIRGDSNWIQANLPQIPGATTRPELNPEKPNDELLSAAESAYKEILQLPQNDLGLAPTSARIGLAAVSENRHEWDQARQYYQQVIAVPAASAAFKDMARERQSSLTEISRPLFVATTMPSLLPPKEPEAPTTLPATPLGPQLPTTQPTTLPTPVFPLPTTRPATGG